MDILRRARKLESTLARTLDRASQGWANSGPREPLEVLHAVIDAVEERIEPAGRGRHVFPFNTIKVSVVADSRDVRARFAAILDGDPAVVGRPSSGAPTTRLLQERIAKRLRDAGCDPADLRVTIAYVARPEPQWIRPEFHVAFDRVARAAPAPAERGPAPAIRLTIVQGSAEKPAYAFALSRINLGRCAEVRDSLNRLVRTNHVAFADGADANHSVSRRHAHIEYAQGSGHYRLSDDRSAHGTSIVRNGRTIPVPAGSRGVKLQSGDEIVVGEARARIRLDES